MKRKYEAPQFEIEHFSISSLITTSTGMEDEQNEGEF